jgi:hypothetical protein
MRFPRTACLRELKILYLKIIWWISNCCDNNTRHHCVRKPSHITIFLARPSQSPGSGYINPSQPSHLLSSFLYTYLKSGTGALKALEHACHACAPDLLLFNQARNDRHCRLDWEQGVYRCGIGGERYCSWCCKSLLWVLASGCGLWVG